MADADLSKSVSNSVVDNWDAFFLLMGIEMQMRACKALDWRRMVNSRMARSLAARPEVSRRCRHHLEGPHRPEPIIVWHQTSVGPQ